ncbi:putative zinc-binding metallopeptidase [Alloprevotella sp. oral taxon 473]|uniref:putative zinc-binding metallopeptidase n=1 Tax=Alloprevotella sp. oral taxon 473 TaxID=712469 RepID=UPI0002A1F0B5|nr:putative zinc-binding metallopeptidase [Alloprevotella sp. oral taxon 473]EKX92782.1 hypothetical protein HMPREF9999_00591 [Alloprevotella sp. oral taxon 473 str. F0040]
MMSKSMFFSNISALRHKFCALALLVLGISAFSSCGEDALSSTSVIAQRQSSVQETELDRWIRDSITLPYGIEVVYRQENHGGAATDYLYPPRTEQVKPVLRAFRTLCLESFAFADQDRSNFLLGRAPLRLVLYGGAYADAHGMVRLSLPQAPTTMMLTHCNAFSPDDPNKVYLLARMGFHQLTRRLLAQLPYDRVAFSAISGDRYTGSTASLVAPWQAGRTIDQQFGIDSWANKRGFLTIHGMVSSEEDMAEMISATICATPLQVQQALTEAATPDTDADPEVQARYTEEAKVAAQQLRRKQAFVTDYLQKVWHVDFRRWQITTARKLRSYRG